MRIIFLIIVLGILGLGGYLYYVVQTVTHDPEVWHVDPLQVPPSDTPNDYRVAPSEFTPHLVQMEAPIYEATAAALAQAFDSFVMGQPRVERVAGTVDEGWLTYVQRTEMLQLPDYITVRFYDLDPPEEEEAEPAAPVSNVPQAVVIEGVDAPAPEPVAPVAADTTPAPLMATIAIYSRSRFGYGDLGVNEARVKSWLTALESFEQQN